MSGPSRFVCAAIVLLALALLPVGTHAEGPDPAAERVAVLNAGTFIVVEVHQAKLGEVLQRVATHLKAELFNADQLVLERIIDGRKRGSVAEVLRWLVPEASFVLISEEPKEGDPLPPKLVRIWFAKPGETVAAAVAGAAVGKPVDPAKGKLQPGTTLSPQAGSAGPGTPYRPSGADLAAGKPDIASTPKSEIMSVAEQLQAQTPQAQLAIEAAAHDPSGQSPPPAFLAPQGDAAQLSLQQQMQRAQALAVEQLNQLMEAYGAACGSPGKLSKPDGPC